MKHTRQDLINNIAARHNLTKLVAASILTDVFASIEELAKGDGLTIHNFGTFKYKTRAAFTARNPRTTTPIQVPAKESLRFSPTKRSK